MERLIGAVVCLTLVGHVVTLVMPTRPGCVYGPNEEQCYIEIYCNEGIDINFFHVNGFVEFPNCDMEKELVIYSTRFRKMYLTAKNFKTEEFNGMERLHLNNEEANIIYSLDLSKNGYSSLQTLPIMSNLHILNISNNALNEAKLSNPEPLDSLTDIDYSHNTINTIIVDGAEHAYRKLKNINLSHNYLVSIQEAVFDSFVELESLDLSYNFIDSLSILTFDGTKNLLHLNLKHNRLTELNSALLRFGKLLDLDISENKFENIRFTDFEKLNNLKTLDLSSNLLVNVDKKVFERMTFLEKLDLSDNLLCSLDKEIFGNLSSLTHVDLSANKLKTLPRDLFRDKHLSEFSIKDNTLEGPLVRGYFEGLKLILNLDLSNQRLSSVVNYAFHGLEKLNTLLLNNNRLTTLSQKSFNTLRSLEILDLSNNQIINIEFEKDDLVSLRSLLLQRNAIIAIRHEFFAGLNMLQFLDLSNNNITQLSAGSFQSLRDLLNFQISNNPISGILEENTFEGLNSLPSLDISNTMLILVKNGSFNGMIQLTNLNISHSKIAELQFNSFLRTGHIETIDLSFNELRDFHLNTTDLVNLQNLILSNNLLVTISSNFFSSLPRLSKIDISHNQIQGITGDAFQDQTDLRYLDLSYNQDLHVNMSQFEKTPYLTSLLLSAIHTNISFKQIKDIRLSHLEMSNAEICNVTALKLKQLKHLDDLILTHNNITEIEVEAFQGVEKLLKLDLSYNRIEHIQPGAFKDNGLLQLLNVSHNRLQTVSYGIFRGLFYLDTIDMSYNEIGDLRSERFYEVRSLSVLIADHNRINAIDGNEFTGTSLTKLSIGDNPIPCHIITKLKKSDISFVITAIYINENKDENVDGITCNKDHFAKLRQGSNTISRNENVLIDIKDILNNLTHSHVSNTPSVVDNTKYLTNFSSEISKLGSNLVQSEINTTLLLKNSNTLLDKILKVLTTINNVRKSEAIPITKENLTSAALVPYINKMKEDLEETIAIEKQNILTEVDDKIKASLSNSHEKSALVSATHEAYSTNDESDSKSFVFIEVCLALILVILVLFILYKFYNSGMFIPSRHSNSTRHLSDALENSTL